jgi:iron-sulfur cluster assembly protein
MGLVSEKTPGDVLVEQGDIRLYVEPDSVPLLAGVTVDFVIGMEGSGFTFDNPTATKSCSCGKSFG